MRQTYQTSTGQTVHAILAYHQLTAICDKKEITYRVPQKLRGEARCTIRRKDWARMSSLLDALEQADE